MSEVVEHVGIGNAEACAGVSSQEVDSNIQDIPLCVGGAAMVGCTRVEVCMGDFLERFGEKSIPYVAITENGVVKLLVRMRRVSL